MVSGARVLSLSSVRSHLVEYLFPRKFTTTKIPKNSNGKNDYEVTSIFYLPAGEESSYFFRVKDQRIECNAYDNECQTDLKRNIKFPDNEIIRRRKDNGSHQTQKTNMEHIYAIQCPLSPPPGFNRHRPQEQRKNGDTKIINNIFQFNDPSKESVVEMLAQVEISEDLASTCSA